MTQPNDRRAGAAFAAALLIILVGLNVRSPITSVSPLLAPIGEEFQLTTSGLAVLTAIPVLLFAIASPLAPALLRGFGLERAVAALLVILALAVLLRPLGAPPLFLTTVAIGICIAVLGILLPQLIRTYFPRRVGLWAGIYTTSFGVSAAAGAGFAVPVLMMLEDSVRLALAIWGVPVAVAGIFACFLTVRLRSGGARMPVRSDRKAGSTLLAPGIISVTGFFGCQALVYFSLTSWLPTIYIARGMAPADAGLLLAWMSIAGLPASLLAPTLASRRRLRTPLVVAIAVLAAAGLSGVIFGPTELAGVAVALLGIAQSAAFGLAVALIVFAAPSVEATAGFSAVAQGAGYGLAALGPLLMGMLAQWGVPWHMTVLILLAVAGGQLVFGIGASRASQLAETRAASFESKA